MLKLLLLLLFCNQRLLIKLLSSIADADATSTSAVVVAAIDPAERHENYDELIGDQLSSADAADRSIVVPVVSLLLQSASIAVAAAADQSASTDQTPQFHCCLLFGT